MIFVLPCLEALVIDHAAPPTAPRGHRVLVLLPVEAAEHDDEDVEGGGGGEGATHVLPLPPEPLQTATGTSRGTQSAGAGDDKGTGN